MKLALVLDKSNAFVSFHRERILKEWSVAADSVKKISKFNEAGGATLFGGDIISILHSEKPEDVKQLVLDMEAAEKNDSFEDKVSHGMIITSNVAQTQTKKLKKIVENNSGEICVSGGANKTSATESLLQNLNLNRSTYNFLVAYVGEDYDSVIPLVKSIEPLPSQQQQKITEEDIFVRLPQKPGAVPPWEIEKHLMSGDTTKAIDTLRRVSASSSFLVVLAIIKNKLTAAYKLSAALSVDSKLSDDDLATLSGASKKSLWAVKKYNQRYSVALLEKAVQETISTEAQVKGGSSVSADILMEVLIIKLSALLSSKR